MIWTDARINTLREMWPNPECPASAIAAHLGGITRMAVIGKARRLGLIRKPKRNVTDPASIYRRELRAGKHRRPRKPKNDSYIYYQHQRDGRQPSQPAVDLPFLPPPEVPSEPCQLMELRNNTCRFPIGHVGEPDFHFCGGKSVRGYPYCTWHARIAYHAV